MSTIVIVRCRRYGTIASCCGSTERDETGRSGAERREGLSPVSRLSDDSSRARKWAHDIPTIHDFNGHYGDAACPLCREIGIFTPLGTLGVEINRLAFAAKLPSH